MSEEVFETLETVDSLSTKSAPLINENVAQGLTDQFMGLDLENLPLEEPWAVLVRSKLVETGKLMSTDFIGLFANIKLGQDFERVGKSKVWIPEWLKGLSYQRSALIEVVQKMFQRQQLLDDSILALCSALMNTGAKESQDKLALIKLNESYLQIKRRTDILDQENSNLRKAVAKLSKGKVQVPETRPVEPRREIVIDPQTTTPEKVEGDEKMLSEPIIPKPKPEIEEEEMSITPHEKNTILNDEDGAFVLTKSGSRVKVVE